MAAACEDKSVKNLLMELIEGMITVILASNYENFFIKRTVIVQRFQGSNSFEPS